MKTGRRLRTLGGYTSSLNHVAFSPDGRYLATGSPDKTAIIWSSFPWNEDDYPGDRSMSYDKRAEIYKAVQRKERQKAIERVDAFIKEKRAHDERDLELRASNLRKIHAAISHYRSEHNDQLPNWLSDLVPEYVNTEVLLCPCDAVNWSSVCPDPEVPCSYGYQFSPEIRKDRGISYRAWKTQQLNEFGDVVPTVRCPYHGEFLLNLSHGGELYLSPRVWENHPREAYSTPHPSPNVDSLLTKQGILVFQKGAYPDPQYGGCWDAHISSIHPNRNTGGCEHLEEGCYHQGNGGRELARVGDARCHRIGAVLPGTSQRELRLEDFAGRRARC